MPSRSPRSSRSKSVKSPKSPKASKSMRTSRKPPSAFVSIPLTKANLKAEQLANKKAQRRKMLHQDVIEWMDLRPRRPVTNEVLIKIQEAPRHPVLSQLYKFKKTKKSGKRRNKK